MSDEQNPQSQQNGEISVQQGLEILYKGTRVAPFTADQHEGFLKVANEILGVFNGQQTTIESLNQQVKSLNDQLASVKNAVETAVEKVD